MHTRRSKEEVDAEIQRLKDIRPRLRPTTSFGEDNLEALEATIEALEEDLSESDCWNKLDEEEWSQHVFDWAEPAVLWREGVSDDLPSEGLPLQ